MKIEGEIIKTHCISCKVHTNQLVRAKYKPKEQADYELYENNEYCVTECLGCNNISFIHQKWDNDKESLDENGEPLKVASIFMEDERWFEDYEFLNEQDMDALPATIYNLYEELMEAMQHQSSLLAGVGLRMLIEAVCIQQKIPGRKLNLKIKNLLERGFISKKEFEVLDKLREIGNVSAHQIKGPSDSLLEAALFAINHLLRSIYVVHKRTKRLRRKATKK